ncbi:hypothetical protein [Streptomyces pseudovenezuelae]|uniref:Uncharacterized protein n=1 Tax=Streptomyces pseudovenezuelae TaxID=67350 RepID=A0ABZ1WNU1_9ACTN|nr:hypothetical protein [Streptomyces pseudovenezuelae]
MSMPLRRYADDHVRTVVALTTGLRLPGLPYGGEDRPGTGRPDPAGHPRRPADPAAPERQERTP